VQVLEFSVRFECTSKEFVITSTKNSLRFTSTCTRVSGSVGQRVSKDRQSAGNDSRRRQSLL